MLIKNLSPKQWVQIKHLIQQNWPKVSQSELDKTHGDLSLIEQLIKETYGEDEIINGSFDKNYDTATFISNISKMLQANADDTEESSILNPSYEKLSCNDLLN